ncbi:MAG: type II toxin-antitoxin system RelE/ParE family toxin [Ruminococcaceae bacterium]|nr:type II toxin-antitoxin system RelE/ParE family toxin [Oscillospiraceae bacterium]
MYKINITKAAENDLQNAAFYIANNLKNKMAADRLLDSAEKELTSLCDTPERNPLVRDSFLASNGVRIQKIKNYLAFYVVRNENHSVTVLRILHSRRDWITILTNEIVENY